MILKSKAQSAPWSNQKEEEEEEEEEEERWKTRRGGCGFEFKKGWVSNPDLKVAETDRSDTESHHEQHLPNDEPEKGLWLTKTPS